MKFNRGTLLKSLITASILLMTTSTNAMACNNPNEICEGQEIKSKTFKAVEDVSITKAPPTTRPNPHDELLLDVQDGTGPRLKDITFIKFDVSDLLGATPGWATLRLFGSGSNLINVFYVEDDSWTETSNLSWSQWKGLLGRKVGERVISENQGWYEIQLNLKRFNLSDDLSDGFLSLGINARHDNDNILTNFQSSENQNGPELVIDYCGEPNGPGDTPVPEPASAVLGLMGIAGALGLGKGRRQA